MIPWIIILYIFCQNTIMYEISFKKISMWIILYNIKYNIVLNTQSKVALISKYPYFTVR